MSGEESTLEGSPTYCSEGRNVHCEPEENCINASSTIHSGKQLIAREEKVKNQETLGYSSPEVPPHWTGGPFESRLPTPSNIHFRGQVTGVRGHGAQWATQPNLKSRMHFAHSFSHD
jgi:hypothetical protein